MSDYYVGEIRIMAGLIQKQPPENWLVCNGSLLSITQYQVLYSLLGTLYGGDGVTTFALPDLRGRLCINQGTGVANLAPRTLAQKGGTEFVSLSEATMPPHTHTLNTAGTAATSPTVASTVTFANTTGANTMYAKDGLATTVATKVNPADSTISDTGAGQSHDNIMPSLALYYIIATNGLYPQGS
ncbi:MAG: phage tail protein [Sulfuricella sp.]|nr:phage tail protein [Sulfuricella sp.]